MTDMGWLLVEILQLQPSEAPIVWYGAITVVALIAVGIGIYAYMLRSQLTREQPIDSERLLNAFEDPLVVLDPDDEVLVANVPFRSLFGSDLRGDPLAEVLAEYPAMCEAVTDREDGTVSAEVGGETRHYDVRAYPAGAQPRPPRKWVIVLQDVTDHHERDQESESHSEQLDQFASLISHDLRNPLDVAIGRTNVVSDALDDPELESHLNHVKDAHVRMQEIITDVLALARDDEELGRLEPVPLETAAMDAWSHVDTREAELTVPTQLVVQADRDRFHRVLENLFRNAVEHGGDDVAITVGELDGGVGFYVEDDGPGIPPDRRESIFQAGYSDGENGTGLGLAIVENIAEAHDWAVRVTDSEAGGARFEFTGVDQTADDIAPQAAE